MEFMQGSTLDETTPAKEKCSLVDKSKGYHATSWFWSTFNPPQQPFNIPQQPFNLPQQLFKLPQQPFNIPQQEPQSYWAARTHGCSYMSRQTTLGAKWRQHSAPPSPTSSRLSEKSSSLPWWSEAVAGSWNTFTSSSLMGASQTYLISAFESTQP